MIRGEDDMSRGEVIAYGIVGFVAVVILIVCMARGGFTDKKPEVSSCPDSCVNIIFLDGGTVK